MRVFLSYRRTDDRHLAGRLRDVLAIEVGDDNVFFDVDSITAGQDFRVAIRDYIDGIDVMIALIGPRWDSSRLAVTTDPVRMELAEAFRRAKPVIPVLIEDTPMPSPGELPHELEQLSFLNALVVRPDPDFRGDAARVARAAHLAHERGTVGARAGAGRSARTRGPSRDRTRTRQRRSTHRSAVDARHPGRGRAGSSTTGSGRTSSPAGRGGSRAGDGATVAGGTRGSRAPRLNRRGRHRRGDRSRSCSNSRPTPCAIPVPATIRPGAPARCEWVGSVPRDSDRAPAGAGRSRR